MTTDFKQDIEKLLSDTLSDLDMYYVREDKEDAAYMDGQIELIGRIMEIKARYE